jgi:hypothetical protein
MTEGLSSVMAMSIEVVWKRKRRDERGGENDQETLLSSLLRSLRHCFVSGTPAQQFDPALTQSMASASSPPGGQTTLHTLSLSLILSSSSSRLNSPYPGGDALSTPRKHVGRPIRRVIRALPPCEERGSQLDPVASHPWDQDWWDTQRVHQRGFSRLPEQAAPPTCFSVSCLTCHSRRPSHVAW